MSSLTMTMAQRAEAADEAYRMSHSTKGAEPRDVWKDAAQWYPKKSMVVLIFDGLTVQRARYDEEKHKWYDEEGKSIFVFMWRRI